MTRRRPLETWSDTESLADQPRRCDWRNLPGVTRHYGNAIFRADTLHHALDALPILMQVDIDCGQVHVGFGGVTMMQMFWTWDADCRLVASVSLWRRDLHADPLFPYAPAIRGATRQFPDVAKPGCPVDQATAHVRAELDRLGLMKAGQV